VSQACDAQASQCQLDRQFKKLTDAATAPVSPARWLSAAPPFVALNHPNDLPRILAALAWFRDNEVPADSGRADAPSKRFKQPTIVAMSGCGS
jgi:hypothetical protein